MATGVRPEKGLQMVVRNGGGGLGEAVALVYGSEVIEQRCLFHKLRNVSDNCRGEFAGEEKREEKKPFLEQARAIYQAESAAEARRRLATCADTWRERAPKGVATLERDARADDCLLRPTRSRPSMDAHDLLVRANQSRMTAQISASRQL